MKKERFIVLVIDGLGVGATTDIEATYPEDSKVNTLKSCLLYNPRFKLPEFEAMGLLQYFIQGNFRPICYKNKSVSLGRLEPNYAGADSYLGHQEISGINPTTPNREFIYNLHNKLQAALQEKGYSTSFDNFIVVEDHIAIADNIETDYGLNINVIGSLDHIEFNHIQKIGEIVRENSRVGRIITMGGTYITRRGLEEAYEVRERNGYTARGINIPRLNIYNQDYRVEHLGLEFDNQQHITRLMIEAGLPVTLIGKTADMIKTAGANRISVIDTAEVFYQIKKALSIMKRGLIFANIQQTDLAGHNQDIQGNLEQLSIISNRLPNLIGSLDEKDTLIITGDHGNDPLSGHSFHTREMTPLVLLSSQVPPTDYLIRSTLADIGYTVSKYFGIKTTERGSSLF